MNSHITELTIQQVETMDRSSLIQCFRELCEFLPGHRKLESTDRISLSDLRNLVKKTRRCIQARGY